jgi:hypothetical protein
MSSDGREKERDWCISYVLGIYLAAPIHYTVVPMRAIESESCGWYNPESASSEEGLVKNMNWDSGKINELGSNLVPVNEKERTLAVSRI